MVPEDDARNTVILDDRYVILPVADWSWLEPYKNMPRCPEGFRYSSDTNDRWLTRDQLVTMLEHVPMEGP
jgi:UDP-N-acetylglucosamine 4,6-dehydratase